MIKVYCLVDPRNNKPFYVGATKILLKNRLSNHIHEARVFMVNKYSPQYSCNKHFLIQELVAYGLRPRIDLLYISPLLAVEHYEAFFHNVLVGQGFNIHNSTSQFNYLKYTKVSYYNFHKNT